MPRSGSTPRDASVRRADASSASSPTSSRTGSRPWSARTISTYSRRASSRWPGQVAGACGQASQVAACGSHSAGQRRAIFSSDIPVSLGSAWPDRRRRRCAGRAGRASGGAPRSMRAELALDQQRLLALGGRARQHAAEGVGHERLAPEADAFLAADAVHRRHEDAVGDRVAALHGLPGVVLRGVHRLALVELPADRRRVEEHLRAAERGQPRGLGEPLVPAHQHADARVARREDRGSRGRRA